MVKRGARTNNKSATTEPVKISQNRAGEKGKLYSNNQGLNYGKDMILR